MSRMSTKYMAAFTAVLFGLYSHPAYCTHQHTPLGLAPDIPEISETGESYRIAKVYWLPDYQNIYNSNINDPDVSGPPDGGDGERRCEDYGLVSACGSGMSGELRRPVPELRCYANCRCADIYQYDDSNCRPPYYGSGNSCGGKYEKCELNIEEACDGYVKSCSEGWQLRLDGRCEYDDSYGTCCNLCEGYDYGEIPEGYVETGRCESCTGTKYKIEINPCDGFSECRYGAEIGAKSCQSGSKVLYDNCKKCLYECTLSSCPAYTVCSYEDCSGLYCATGCVEGSFNEEDYWSGL